MSASASAIDSLIPGCASQYSVSCSDSSSAPLRTAAGAPFLVIWSCVDGHVDETHDLPLIVEIGGIRIPPYQTVYRSCSALVGLTFQ